MHFFVVFTTCRIAKAMKKQHNLKGARVIIVCKVQCLLGLVYCTCDEIYTSVINYGNFETART